MQSLSKFGSKWLPTLALMNSAAMPPPLMAATARAHGLPLPPQRTPGWKQAQRRKWARRSNGMGVTLLMLWTVLPSCSSMNTPNGHRITLGTDTQTYISAKGNVMVNPDAGTVQANEMVMIGSEKQGETFRSFWADAVKGFGYSVLGGVAKSGIGAWKSAVNSKQVTQRTGLKETGLTDRSRINADAATAQAEIAN